MTNDTGSESQPAQEERCAACGGPLEASARYCPSCGRPSSHQPPDVDIAGWVRASWNLFEHNIGAAIGIPLVVLVPTMVLGLGGYLAMAGLAVAGSALEDALDRGPGLFALAAAGGVVWLIGLIFAFVVIAALVAGVCACFLDGIRSRRLTTAHLWDGFRQWWACTWVCWALALAATLCSPFMVVLIGIPVVFALYTLMWLALFHIVDQRRGGTEALAFAWNAMRGRLWMMLLFTFLMFVLQSAGAAAMYFGILVTSPIVAAALAAGYDALSRRGAARAC